MYIYIYSSKLDDFFFNLKFRMYIFLLICKSHLIFPHKFQISQQDKKNKTFRTRGKVAVLSYSEGTTR